MLQETHDRHLKRSKRVRSITVICNPAALQIRSAQISQQSSSVVYHAHGRYFVFINQFKGLDGFLTLVARNYFFFSKPKCISFTVLSKNQGCSSILVIKKRTMSVCVSTFSVFPSAPITATLWTPFWNKPMHCHRE